MRVRDLLGFQGEKQFDFASGIQVLQAPNHTGKTSLAMAVLWGLTGLIPRLGRLNLKSFRLFNRLAGENAASLVVIGLDDGAGGRMEIRRRYAGRTRDTTDTVELTFRDEKLAGAEADVRILQELGLQPGSLESCGVVLQDHRLKLITGTNAESSDVVNDMLGLEALSEVVPALEDMSGQADGLRKEIEAYLKGGSPLDRWLEKERELADAIRERENDALEAGYDATSIENPESLLRAELIALSADLSAEPPVPRAAPRTEIERLRKRLGTLRKAGPPAGELAEVGAQYPHLDEAGKSARRLGEKWRKHDAQVTAEAAAGELDVAALSRTISQSEAELKTTDTLAGEAREEQTLLQVAYQHMLQHPDAEACPLWLTRMPVAALQDGLKETAGCARGRATHAADSAGSTAEEEKEDG